MLKKTVTYTDFNDKPQKEDLYFNLTRVEMADLLDLQEKIQQWQNLIAGAERALTTDEIRQILEILNRIVKAAYGERSEDGKRFRKSEEIYRDFKDSAAYDAFMMGLFDNEGQDAIDFILGVLPKEMLSQMDSAELPAGESEEKPAWIRENREPTQAELATMSPTQLREAFQRKSEQNLKEV